MKKIAFALYVLGIMIMFPCFVALELNHENQKTSEYYLPDDNVTLVERKAVQETAKVKIQKDVKPFYEISPSNYNLIQMYPFTGLKNLF
jgi:hypothetical protein